MSKIRVRCDGSNIRPNLDILLEIPYPAVIFTVFQTTKRFPNYQIADHVKSRVVEPSDHIRWRLRSSYTPQLLHQEIDISLQMRLLLPQGFL